MNFAIRGIQYQHYERWDPLDPKLQYEILELTGKCLEKLNSYSKGSPESDYEEIAELTTQLSDKYKEAFEIS